MKYPIDVNASGAISLGDDISCDGFLSNAKARVQTHIHSDHMSGFDSSKGIQDIIMSEPTRQLLICEHNAELPYRSNIKSLDKGEWHKIGTSKVYLVPSGHMLGAVQVLVELSNGTRLGYSGDFQWPLDEVIKVDGLVVDGTYGSPSSVRRFSQGECEERLITLINQRLVHGSVYIKAHRGTIQRALQLISVEIDCPIIASARLCKEINIYKNFGYTIGSLVDADSLDGKQLVNENRLIRVYSTGDSEPTDMGNSTQITLSAYFTRSDEPVTEYSKRAFAVALSNHADFEGTIEYVKATGARFVVTDNTRGGKAIELAKEIRDLLNINASPSSNYLTREWGQ